MSQIDPTLATPVNEHLRLEDKNAAQPTADHINGNSVSGPQEPRFPPPSTHTALKPPAHGYGETPITPALSSRSVSEFDSQAQIHPHLRAAPNYAAHTATMMPSGPGQASETGGSTMAGPSNLPVAGPGSGTGATSDDQVIDGRKAKRELSQSKRAAQNRAAQRAFRQRKEGYIKKLEQQVRDYTDMENNFKSMQTENYSLREYVIHLQSRLLDVHGECPPPPPNINLNHPHPPPSASAPPSSVPESASSTSTSAGNGLEAVAQAVAGYSARERLPDNQYESKTLKPEANDDTRTAEEISRQLHSEGLPGPSGLPV